MINVLFPPRSINGNEKESLASAAYLHWLASDYEAQQAHYVNLRRWYDGKHRAHLTNRLLEFITASTEFPWSLNYLRLPVELLVERLSVTGFDGPPGIGGSFDKGNELRGGSLLGEWWMANRMDAMQSQIHRAAIRDGDTYVLIEWDNENGRPVFSHEPAFDGEEGMKVHYLSNLRRTMTMASKRWTEERVDERGVAQRVTRLNLYLPDGIEKYIQDGRQWGPYRENPDDAWPIPWPVGVIPVVHFRYKDDGGNWGESELDQLIPIQSSLNKSVIDLLTAADISAFQLPTLTGAEWTDDAGGITPGTVLSVKTADARWGVIPPADLSQLRAVVTDHITWMAQMSRVPLVYFHGSRQVSSAETQQADDSQLVAKVAGESVAFGNAWEDVMYIALKLNQEYGDGRDLARGESLSTEWADFERVDRLAVEDRRADIALKYVQAGADLNGALRRLGLSDDDIAAMQPAGTGASDAYRQASQLLGELRSVTTNDERRG